ncbi:MAG TPA: hypothetical protein VGM13_10825 [Thermoanaerobaculia bacterium]
MSRVPNRLTRVFPGVVLSAVLTGLAGGSVAAPVTTVKQPAAPASAAAALAMPAGAAVSPEAAERLRKAGLDPKDPNLGAKLRSLAAGASAGYARAHVMSSTAASSGGAGSAKQSIASKGVSGGASSARFYGLPVPGTIVAAYDVSAAPLPGNRPISAQRGNLFPGLYNFLVRTNKKISVKSGPAFSAASTSLSYGCAAALDPIHAMAAAADDPSFQMGLPALPPSGGAYSYYVTVQFPSLPVGQARAAQMTLSFENVATAPYGVTLLPDTGTATVSVTIDQSPQVAGVGSVSPWGSTNLSNANAKLGNPSTPRVGAGNWQTQTSGDDLVGVSVGLGPGWTVTSTAVKSAMSGTSPQDLSPDNAWRGAAVTMPPSGSDLRTAVHWHYSGIDSLTYTLEWRLAGPMGQRPLLTMAKYGSCDQ